MKKLILTITFSIVVLIGFSQSPIPSSDGVYYNSAYLLDTNYSGTVDTTIFHAYYEEYNVNDIATGFQMNIYKVQRKDGVWDTVKGSLPILLEGGDYDQLHTFLWNVDIKDSADKYLDRYFRREKPYLQVRYNR